MTTHNDVDVLVSRWLEATAPTREPEHLLGDVLATVDQTRRRPAWRIPERWIPMQTTLRWQPGPRLVPLVLVSLLVIALVAAVAFVGSRPRLPLPTGLAANGQIAYTSDGQLWVAGANGSNTHPITSDTAVKGVPTWSRDGTKVAYLALEPGWTSPTGRASLVVADADGGHAITLLDDVEALRYVTWSPDARQIAYSYWANMPTFQQDRIFIAQADGAGTPARIGDPALSAFYPAFSPDGNRIAFVSDHAPDQCGSGDCLGENSFGLHVMSADGSDVRVLAHASIQPHLGAERWARVVDWSFDGSTVLLSGVDTSTPLTSALFTVAADGSSAPRRVETGSGIAYGGSYSPAGDRIAYVRGAGDGWEAVVADTDGGNARVVASGISRFAPQWSPDGRSIAVVDPVKASTAIGPTATVRIIPVDGQDSERAIRLALHEPADDPIAPTTLGIDQISWQRLAP